jgi:predicted AAA+ superfamily ATPase
MHRFAEAELQSWRDRPDRKPLVIRGARQVGKTHLCQTFGRAHFQHVAVINFERDPLLGELFDRADPRDTVRLLEAHTRTPVLAGRTLLFLDEVQAAPSVLARLRYFAEELPDLHVIAAGSLLDFTLQDHKFSMPVGRISYLHMEPMCFEEFLIARGEEGLRQLLLTQAPGDEMPKALHRRLMDLLREYLYCGGMPAAVKVFVESGSLIEVQRVQQDLLATVRDDFSKYQRRVNRDRLLKVFAALPRLVGRKFVAAQIDREEKAAAIKDAFQLLCLARIATPVWRTAGSGVPLGAQRDDSHFKVCLLDVGLYSALCGLDATTLVGGADPLLVNSGQLAEQFIGQELRAARPLYQEPALYYWTREQRTANAEVDYLIQHGSAVVPIEVKAGTTGQLRSLHQFLREKSRSLAVRMDASPPSFHSTHVTLPDGSRIPLRLLSLPLYMCGQLRRLLDALGGAAPTR